MEAAEDERAVMDLMLELMRDSNKLKSWMSSHCKTETVTGDELEMHWQMDYSSTTPGTGLPGSLTVCRSSDDSILQVQTYDLLTPEGKLYWSGWI